LSQTPKVRLRDADPKGRVDALLLRTGEQFAKQVGAEKIWKNGLGDVVEELLENSGLSKPITGLDVAREIGILPRRQRALR